MILVGTNVALADNVVNDIAANGGDTVDVGETTSIGFKIVATATQQGDTQQGCNAADGTPAAVTIHYPEHVSAVPDVLTFTRCNAFQDVIFSGDTAGDYEISATADDAGSGTYASHQATFILHVGEGGSGADTTAPQISISGDMEAEASGPDGATVDYSISAEDDSGGAVELSCQPPSGATFPLGVTLVHCVATDTSGNSAEATFSVTVSDTTAPAIDAHDDVYAEATGPGGAIVDYGYPAWHDAVDGDGVASCVPASGETYALGRTEVTCSASDAAGNSAASFFDVWVVDTTPPAIEGHDDIVVEATGPDGAAVDYLAPASHDLVDGDGVATCDPAAGSMFALGDSSVDCVAADAAGNSASSGFTVSVVDTTPPVLSLPADFLEAADGYPDGTVSYEASAWDLVDGAVAVVCDPASGSLFAYGTTTVTCSATDSRGNSASGSFDVTVYVSWCGFQPPLANGRSVFKLGSIIPVKFCLTAESAGITDLVAHIYVKKLSNSASGTEIAAGSTSAADVGNTFRYSADGAQYIFNLGTKTLSRGMWQIRVDLGDGVWHTTNVSLK